MEQQIKELLKEEQCVPSKGNGGKGQKEDATNIEASSPRVCSYTQDEAGLVRLCEWIQAHKDDILALTKGGTVFPCQSSESDKVCTHVLLPGLDREIPARAHTLIDITAGLRAVYGASQWITRFDKDRAAVKYDKEVEQLSAVRTALIQVQPVREILQTPAGEPLLKLYAPIIGAALGESVEPGVEKYP